MKIDIELVKELRQITGAGVVECRDALSRSGGVVDEAIKILREMGQSKAVKKSSRVASSGVVSILCSENNKSAFMAEINTETDFVAGNKLFSDFVSRTMRCGLKFAAKDVPSILDINSEDGVGTISEDCNNLIAVIGENIKIRRVALLQNPDGVIGSYCHNNKLGVIVNLSTDDPVLGRNIAMHIAASRPAVVNPEDIPAELIDQEKDLFLKQASQSGKPAEVIEKMVAGRINKFVNEISLVGQPYIKDTSITVGELLKNSSAVVLSFVRFELGDGIEGAL